MVAINHSRDNLQTSQTGFQRINRDKISPKFGSFTLARRSLVSSEESFEADGSHSASTTRLKNETSPDLDANFFIEKFKSRRLSGAIQGVRQHRLRTRFCSATLSN